MRKWTLALTTVGLAAGVAAYKLAKERSGGVLRFEYGPGELAQARFRELCEKPDWQDASFEPAAGVRLRGLVRTPQSTNAPWIILFAGNGSDLLEGSQHLVELLRSGDDMGAVIYAYRGFDGSAGTPDRATLRADARAIYSRVRHHHGVPAAQLRLVGFSLGTHLALHVARYAGEELGEPPHSLVLLAPFTAIDVSPPGLLGRLIGRERYSNLEEQTSLPTLVVHGKLDEALPHAQGKELADRLGARFVTMDEMGHAQLLTSPTLAATVRPFWASQPD